MVMNLWTYTPGWDLPGLALLERWEVNQERTLLHDPRFTHLYQNCLTNLGIEGVRLMQYPIQMTYRKSFEESRILVNEFAHSSGLRGEFINVEHELLQIVGSDSVEVREGLFAALHRSSPYLTPPANLVRAVKAQVGERLNCDLPPLLCVGAHGKSLSLKATTPEAQVALARRESYPLTLFAQVIDQAAQTVGMNPHFVSVDYRSATEIEQEIEAVCEQFPDFQVWRADIDHNRGDLMWIPVWYEALRQLAQEAGGECIVVTNRSNATHYAAALSPRIPLVILGPTGFSEWDRQAETLNSGLSGEAKSVYSISAETEDELIEGTAEVLVQLVS